MRPNPSRVALAHLTRQAKMDPFKAVQKAVLEVWSKKEGYDLSKLRKDFSRWLRAGDPAGWGPSGTEPVASVFHEYGTAPPEPFNHYQGSGSDNDFNTWKKVEKIASRYAGVDLIFESINPAVSQWFIDEPWEPPQNR